MADLAKLFAKGKPVVDSQLPATPSATGSESADKSTGVAEPVSPPSQGAAGEAAKPKYSFGSKPSVGSGSTPAATAGGTDSASGGSPVGDRVAGPSIASAFKRAASQVASSAPESLAPATIGSLDDLANSTDVGTPTRQRVSGFADETPADQPTRELPEGITKEELGFVDLINGVYHVIHEPDLMGGVIRNIIMELGTHPEYMKLVAPDDIRVWVRGMRDSMGLAQVKKQETKAKKSGPRASKSVDVDMLADLDALGISIPE